MKKTKILVVLGALLAMSLSACGGGKKEEHKHVYENWTQTKAPTCTEKGEEEGKCKCGEKSTRPVNALGHDWGEWTVKTAASCTTDGVEERACKRAGCNEKDTRVVKAAHDWDAEQEIAAGDENQVSFKLANCKKGDAVKADIKAVDAKFYAGKIKSGTPSGYFKLNSKNDKAYWKFTVPGTKLYKGMLYQRGAMDSFSSNTDKSYAATSTSGDNAPEYTRGNFEVKVNGDALDKTQWIRITFDELLADGEDSSAMGDNYSPLCVVPIGECVIQPGLNEITYERLGSYNLIISDLIFIGSEFEHVHAAATTWSSDADNHWHNCTAVGCPTGKLDVAAHTFAEVAPADDTETDAAHKAKAATCSEEGIKVEVCSVCNYRKETKLDKLPHTLGEAYDIVPATCEAAGSQKKKCSVCQEVITEVLPKADHKFGDAVVNNPAGEGYLATTGHNCSVCEKGALRWNALDYDQTASSSGLDRQASYVRFGSGAVENKGGTEGAGSHIIYNVNVEAAQEKVGLAFKIKNTNGNGGKADVFGPVPNDNSIGYIKQADGTLVQSTHRYGLRVNDVEYFLGDNNYGDQSGVTGWFEWPVEFPVKAGINKIDVFAYQGYRAQLMEFELTGLPKFVSAHTHNGADAWVTDDNSHWHACTAQGCPLADGIYDKADHTWSDPYDEVAATCSAKGSYKVKCTVCNYEKTVVTPMAAHTFGEAQAKIGDATPYECSVCHAMAYQLDLASPEKLKKDITWNITGLPAGNYDIELYACAASTTLTQKYDARYQFKVDSGDYVSASDDNATYGSYGLGTGEAQDKCQWSSPINQIAVAADAASFTIHWTNKGYSAFIAAVRLVKAAA